MQLAGIQTALAPLTTGHPMGLPEVENLPEIKAVKPITKRGDMDAAMAEGRPPDQFWRALSGEPDPDTHVAPPSIMQIKISMMLEEQAMDTPVEDDPFNNAQPTNKVDASQESEPQEASSTEAEPVAPSLPAYEEAATLAPEEPKPELPPEPEAHQSDPEPIPQ